MSLVALEVRSIFSPPIKTYSGIAEGSNGSSSHITKSADLVIWDEDPLEPSAMPEYVFIGGENMDLTSRATRLTDRYTKDLDEPVIYRD